MDNAITGNMAHLLVVMRAVKRFKKLLHDKRGSLMEGIFGRDSRLVAPPHSMRVAARSQDTHDRRPMDQELVTGGIHREMSTDDDLERLPRTMDMVALHQPPKAEVDRDIERDLGESGAHYKQRVETMRHHPAVSQNLRDHNKPQPVSRAMTSPINEDAKGHAHDPLKDIVHLRIGYDPEVAASDLDAVETPVSESPPAVEIDVYEQAYQEEMQRILDRRGKEPSMYMTRRVEHREDIRKRDMIKDASKNAARSAAATFDLLSSRGSDASTSIGDAGRAAARMAGGRSSSGTPTQSMSNSERFDAGKQAAKDAASAGLDGSRMAAMSAADKLGLTSGSSNGPTGQGLSNLVSRVQANARGPTEGTIPVPAAPGETGSPGQATEGADSGEDQPNQPQDAPRPMTPKSSDQHKGTMPGVPGGFPISPTTQGSTE